jgi:hypothetical protein
MRLEDAAVFFDTTSVYDAYTGAYLFKAQFSSFNDANVVGSTSTRRILSIGTGLSLPARRAIKILESYWIVGDGNSDAWEEDAIRQSYNMKKAMSLAGYSNPGAMAQGVTSATAYAQLEYFNEQKDPLNGSDSTVVWNVYMAPAETAAVGTVIQIGALYLRVFNYHLPLEGLAVLECQELVGVQTVSFAGTTYDPINDTYSGASPSVPALYAPSTRLYRAVDAMSAKPQVGDISLLVPTALVTPHVGGKVTLTQGERRIVSVVPDRDAWLVQVRDA